MWTQPAWLQQTPPLLWASVSPSGNLFQEHKVQVDRRATAKLQAQPVPLLFIRSVSVPQTPGGGAGWWEASPGGRASGRSPAADHCAAWPSTWKSAREGVTVRGWPDTFINQETHWYPLPGSSSRQEAAGSRWTRVRAAEGLGDQIPPSHPGVSEARFKS